VLGTIIHQPDSDTNAPPLVILHGLYGSARNWGVIARRLAADRMVICIDQRNHGNSPWFASHSYSDMAQDTAQIIGGLGRRVDVLGHSMGGKAAMYLALTQPDCIRKLIVADIAPVAYSHDQTQHIRAMRAITLDDLTHRTKADLQLSQHVDDPNLRAFFLQSLDLKSNPAQWRLNLDVLEREMPKIVGWPAVEGRFDGPTLFLTGALSHYVTPDHRDVIKHHFPKAQFAKIPGAGHWLHAEKPREFELAVSVFLAQPHPAATRPI
jgi:pimeloyl-ACP methyl ester carboxylesterase